MVKKYTNGAFAVVIRDNEVLLAQLPSWAREGEKWTIPGSVVEVGEEPRDGATREVQEETNITIETTDLLRVYPTDDLKLSFYLGEYIKGDIKIQEDELIDARWVPRDEISQLTLAYANTQEVLDLAFAKHAAK
jgi:mutator protein MutT